MKKVLDTSILIYHWRQALQKARAKLTMSKASEQTVRGWARDLVKLQQCNCILTPIYIEFMAGATSARDIRLYRAFLAEFTILDDGGVTTADWEMTLRIAERVPADGRPRQLGDCLIRALARRLNYEVISKDTAFPR